MATIQLRKNLLNTKNVLQKKMQKTIFSIKWLELVGQKPFIYYTCPVKTHRKLKYTVLFQLHSIKGIDHTFYCFTALITLLGCCEH